MVFKDAIRLKRVILSTFGSYGDLHPYIAVGLELQRRGLDAAIATSPCYREKVEATGLGFHPMRPDKPDFDANPDVMRRIMDQRTGTEVVINEFIMPNLRQSYADLDAATDGCDLLVGHPLTMHTRLVAEQRCIPWISSLLQPIGFLSAYDPPKLPLGQFLSLLRPLGPRFFGPLFRFAKWTVGHWSSPWHQFRSELGLPPVKESPLFEGQHSPKLVLALFSKLLAAPQPDWPAQTIVTGFPFYDQDGEANLAPELDSFLSGGSAPIVFTLGTSAVMDAGSFFDESAAAARILGRRAVLLIGKEAKNHLKPLPEGVVAFDYAPYSALFPRCAAIVHQGGVGTTGQAMRAGRPMLVMPYGHDQPDNADRVRRLGIARVMRRERYRASTAANELKKLLDAPGYAAQAANVGQQVRSEDGARAAADAILHIVDNGTP